MTEHSILPPSSFHRLVPCPGSRKLEAMFPREESEAAAEGILAHEYCSLFIRQHSFINHPNSYAWTLEMNHAASMYFEHIKKIIGWPYQSIPHNHPVYEKLHIEERIDIPYLHPECFGTPDCWYYDEDKNELHVWDFKYGFKPVEALENWQLIAYASGIIWKIDKDWEESGQHPDSNVAVIKHMIVNLHIVQPRAQHKDGPIRTWRLTTSALQQYRFMLMNQIEKSFLEKPPFGVGAHCTYCKAKSICPKLKKESQMIVDKEMKVERELNSPNFATKEYVDLLTENQEFRSKEEIEKYLDDYLNDTKMELENLEQSISGHWDVETIKPSLSEEISDTRRSIEILKLRLETLEKQALEKIRGGESVEGFSIKPTFSRIKWTISTREVASLGEELGVNLIKTAKEEVVTPLQAIKAGVPKEKVKELSKCEFKSYKLIAEGEKNDEDEVNFDEL